MKKITVLLLVLCMLLGLGACKKEDEENTDTESDTRDTETVAVLDYSNIDVLDYVESVTYKGLTVLAETEDSRESELWEAILKTAVISEYPEDKVQYYFSQTKQYYMYLANNNEAQYLLVLKHFDTDEARMREKAREAVAKDLVYYYVVAAEGIEITDTEKTALYGKYVDKYVNDYGYGRDYVVANMTELIYESMLYDKTVETLLLCNTVEIIDGEVSQNTDS